MKTVYKIGNDKTHDIIIRNSNYPKTIANIEYVRGHWILKRQVASIPIFINKNEIQDSIKLSKYDIIRIENQNIHWSNYLYEGKNQELQIKDLLSYNGRISLSNFKALNLLIIGLSILVFFLPGLLRLGKRYTGTELQLISELQEIGPIIHT